MVYEFLKLKTSVKKTFNFNLMVDYGSYKSCLCQDSTHWDIYKF